MGETLEELRKHREDIKILFSTLEEAYRDASISEEHYNEVKSKNQEKLDELNEKIAKLENAAEQPAAEEEEKEARPEPAKKEEAKPKKAPKKARVKKTRPKKPEPVPTSTPETPPATTTPSTPEPPEGESQTDYSGIPQPLTDVAGADEAPEVKPDKAPGGARKAGVPGKIRYTTDEIKEMLGKIIKEIKPQGIEVIPRMDKLEVQLEKVIAYVEAMKDERSGGKENTRRLTEEVGELRSSISGMDRKVSDSEMKVQQATQSLGDMKPGRFIKALDEGDKSIKIHDARLDKLDDMNSVMLKKLSQIEEVLKRLGSLEKIVSFSQEAAKRLLEIENREKKISRIADKIDGIFMELNKRLDEFVLYKAKQDTLDELSQEMMKALDGMNTRLEKYAEKTDLEMFKDTIETELVSMRTQSGISPEVQKLQSQKTEIEDLVTMLEEQFKAKAISEGEYNKTKQINMNRLKDIEEKIAAASGTTAAASSQEWPEKEASVSAQSPGTPAKSPGTPAKPTPPAPKTPGQEPPLQGTPSQEGRRAQAPQKEPVVGEETAALPSAPSHPPGRKLAYPEGHKQATTLTPPGAQAGTSKEEMHAELRESHKNGLIGKDALEKTKSLIGGARGLFKRKKEEGNEEEGKEEPGKEPGEGKKE